jgi:hypothetical protein
MTALLAVEASEWNAWAIIALLISNAGAYYKLLKRENRTDRRENTELDAAKETTLVGSWRAWGKAMEKGRVEAEVAKHEAEQRERDLIKENGGLREQVRQLQDDLDDARRANGGATQGGR